MMPQTTKNDIASPVAQPLTCSQCSYFEDYQGTRNRGYCKVFDKVTRRNHSKTENCELSIEFKEQKFTPFPIMVQLITEAIEDNGEGYPVPVDDKILELTVPEMTIEAVQRQIQSRSDCEGYIVVNFWQPIEEDLSLVF